MRALFPESDFEDPNFWHQLGDKIVEEGVPIFHASHDMDRSYFSDFFEKLTKHNVLIPIASGNTFPFSSRSTVINPELAIVVGQLSPVGGMEALSSAYPEVTIAAPGRVYAYFNGDSEVFGGTSAAQPVVTGCLTPVMGLLPSLTTTEAKDLIIKTAIPTLNAQQTHLNNGAGTINCYKLVKVALRLHQDWPSNRSKIHSDSNLYHFEEESALLVKQAASMTDEAVFKKVT